MSLKASGALHGAEMLEIEMMMMMMMMMKDRKPKLPLQTHLRGWPGTSGFSCVPRYQHEIFRQVCVNMPKQVSTTPVKHVCVTMPVNMSGATAK